LFGLCPDVSESDYEKIFVENSIVESPWSIYTFSVFPCTKIPVTDCGQIEEINFGSTLYIIMPKASFDPDNRDTPISFSGNFEESVNLSTKQTMKKNILLKTVEV
jgi:hypothetical protein